MAGKSPPRHGTLSGYVNLGCRCVPCASASREYHRNLKLRQPKITTPGTRKRREAFFAKIALPTPDTPVFDGVPCLEWTAAKNSHGYGQFKLNRRDITAHRISYEMTYGPIPDGAQVDHRCHNRACVNPAHLRTVTNKQNQENLLTRPSSKSGHRGLSWNKRDRMWTAHVGHLGRSHVKHFRGNDAGKEAAIHWLLEKRAELFTHSDGR